VSVSDRAFTHAIPKLYEMYLVPLLFEPYAVYLVARLASRPVTRVPEIAAGTGVVARRMANILPENVAIVATDLNQAMLDEAAAKLSEATAKSLLGAKRWAGDLPWRATLERFLFTPTVNIEGLVAGYTGPGGKTVMPHRAVAKLDLRLVPDMTYDGAIAALKAHLAKRGFGDIEVNPSGGYDPTSTAADAPMIKAMLAVLRRGGIDPVLLPRLAGSYPGYVFTNAPISLAAGHYGLGHGSGAHAPDEYFVIEPSNPRVSSWDGAVASHVAYLYELATLGG